MHCNCISGSNFKYLLWRWLIYHESQFLTSTCLCIFTKAFATDCSKIVWIKAFPCSTFWIIFTKTPIRPVGPFCLKFCSVIGSWQGQRSKRDYNLELTTSQSRCRTIFVFSFSMSRESVTLADRTVSTCISDGRTFGPVWPYHNWAGFLFDFTIDDDLTDIVFAVTRNTGSGTLKKDLEIDNCNQ